MSQDQELKRIQGIINSIDEVQHRMNKLQRDFGDHALERSVKYIGHRRNWFFSQFRKKDNE